MLKMKLELLEIEDLIVVLGPCPENVKYSRETYSEDDKEKHILHMVENYKRMRVMGIFE